MSQATRRYQYEIYPSPIQKRYLSKIFGATRFVFNEFLAMSNGFRSSGQPRLVQSEMQELLVSMKIYHSFLAEIPSQSLQVATHDLEQAYVNASKLNRGQPKFKKRTGRQSFQLPQPKICDDDGQISIFIPNFQTKIPINWHRPMPVDSKVGSATITKTPSGKYYVSFVITFDFKEKLESKNTIDMVGIDINIRHFVLSNGEKIEIPQRLIKLEKRKRRLQKALQRKIDAQYLKNEIVKDELKNIEPEERRKILKELKKNRSRNYEKNNIAINKIYEQIRFQKEDFLHKLALKIYRENQSVAMETLNVKGMMRNRKLARAISYQCWGKFAEIMKFYALQFEKNLHLVDQWYPSSKKCNQCSTINQDLKLGDRKWICDCCKTHHDRDINASINIKNEGGSCPVLKPVERKNFSRRPSGRQNSSKKQESSEFVVAA